jgi:hypothetical protein
MAVAYSILIIPIVNQYWLLLILNFKKMKSLIKFILSVLFLSIVSCTDYVEGINEDPDLLTDSNAENIFQGALLANQFFHTSNTTRDVMIWLNMANGENRQYVALNDWNNSTATQFDDPWNIAYNTLSQSRIIQQKTELVKNYQFKGAAQVIEAHIIGTTTSLWGDVPYSEFKADGSNLTPVFDNQSNVYTALQSLLNEAIVNLEKSGSIPSDKDIYYGGDTNSWIKLAHSLKARYYLHIKNYAMAKSEALLGMDSPSDDFKAQFGTTYGLNFNPFYSFLVYDRDDYMSGDGYAPRILDPSSTLYRGNSKTDESARFLFNYSNFEVYFSPYELNFLCDFDWGFPNGRFGGDSPMPLVTYGEMLLIIAEADARISGVSSGVNAYNNYRTLLNTGYSIGIDNSGYIGETISYLPYEDSDFSAGGMENLDNITPVDALLREIYQERYIYFIGNYEAFTDFRRTNNLAQIQLKSGFSGSAQRFIYPQVEINSNGANVPSPLPKIIDKTPIHQ